MRKAFQHPGYCYGPLSPLHMETLWYNGTKSSNQHIHKYNPKVRNKRNNAKFNNTTVLGPFTFASWWFVVAVKPYKSIATLDGDGVSSQPTKFIQHNWAWARKIFGLEILRIFVCVCLSAAYIHGVCVYV